MKSRVASVVITALAAALFGGCGSNSTPHHQAKVHETPKLPTAQKVENSVAARLALPGAKNYLPYATSAATSRCIARRLVSGIGVRHLISYGVIWPTGDALNVNLTQPAWNKTDAMTVAFAVVDCAPGDSLVSGERKSLVAAIPSNMSASQRRCAVSADRRIAREMIVFIILGIGDRSEATAASDASQHVLTSALAKCARA